MTVGKFVKGLPVFAYHTMRATYYTVALEHVGHTHPDAATITAELLHSLSAVNDFLGQGNG